MTLESQAERFYESAQLYRGWDVTCHKANGKTLVGGVLDLVRAKQDGGIGVKQQPQQYLGCKRFITDGCISDVDRAQVQLGNDVHYKPDQIIRWRCFTQTDRLIQRGFVTKRLEFSAHNGNVPSN